MMVLLVVWWILTEWAEQYHHLGLRLKCRRRRIGSPSVMPWINQIERSLIRCLIFLDFRPQRAIIAAGFDLCACCPDMRLRPCQSSPGRVFVIEVFGQVSQACDVDFFCPDGDFFLVHACKHKVGDYLFILLWKLQKTAFAHCAATLVLQPWPSC